MAVGWIRALPVTFSKKNFLNLLHLAVFSIWRFNGKQLPLSQVHC